ncbi:class I SAM-dependent methyltransferase [Duganella sp. BJB488]|uniref:class I SAM-dependent methyltransferase n=1 Tax=unclassified Duganella TaxID=2636909 RepID=UPI000E347DF5|nr:MULTISPECIES: class I SAM-dependent methyltransferase [unclassified Duganella]RFP26184.1 class I SAM-dependent methyltransferase [Duganella sp. BJB489]RFP28076.1 class I SAM-dependent methyltransferase [Duganella sp. BJB488]RFP37115.1 class I SAM-dependent methyltransferase [Duganella sp. BJB480]
MSAGFYRAFEDRYRGSRELIKQRLRAYEPFFAPLRTLQDPPAALDLGCGRGEWLELLGEQGFRAHGVDLDDGMLAACRERGLDVELGDAVACLRALPDNSLAVVSAFHLVEHIPFELLQTLVAEARRVLLPGGLLIMETPNPENLVVGASSFYLDPTHLRPIPPQLLAFVTEFGGFGRHKVVRLQEEAGLRGDTPVALINVLDGVSPDYAVVAQKRAEAAVLAPFETAFGAGYGLALGQLAQRFEQRLEGRDDALRAALAELEKHTIDSKLRLAGAESGLEGVTRLSQANAARSEELAHALADLSNRVHATEVAQQQAEEARRQIAALLASSSWRITAPWRMVGGWAHRVRAALRARAKAALLGAARALQRAPRLKRLLRPLLLRIPGVTRVYQASIAAGQAMPPEPQAPLGDMSPRALRVYRDLQSALEKTRKH